jgi:hypothetical protein
MVAAISNRIDFFFISKQNIFAKIRISERNTKDMEVKEVKEVKKLWELTIRILNTVTAVTATKGSSAYCSIGIGDEDDVLEDYDDGDLDYDCTVIIGGVNYGYGVTSSPFTYPSN